MLSVSLYRLTILVSDFGMFQLKQVSFQVFPVGIAHQRAIGAHNTMAGLDDGDGVVADGLTHSLCGATPDASGDSAVSGGMAVGYRQQLFPHSELELCTLRTKRRLKIRVSASEIDV